MEEESLRAHAAVVAIAGDAGVDCGELHTQLVCAARFGKEFDEGTFSAPVEHSATRAAWFAAGTDALELAGRLDAMFEHELVAARERRRSGDVNAGDVALLDGSALEGALHGAREFALSHEGEHAGRAEIEALVNAEIRVAPAGFEALRKTRHDVVAERGIPTVSRNAARFVDD